MGSDNGISDEQLLELESYATSPLFGERERTLLEYADAMTVSDRGVDDALFARVESLLTPEEHVELTFVVAYENLLSKFHRTLRVESGSFCRLVVPTVGP